MSAINPVSAQFSTAMTMSTGAVGASATSASGAAAAPADVGSPTGALGVQTSLLMQAGNGMSNVDTLAALALTLLLNKSNESEKNDDSWKMLAALAMMSGAAGGQQTTISVSQSISASPGAYAAGGITAGANVNLQG